MSWFRRRKETAERQTVAGKLPPVQQRAADAGLTFVSRKQNGDKTYVTYSGNDPEKAKAYLRSEPVPHDAYYIVVETPDGVWGTDSNSLYLEKLRPWQLDVDAPGCAGTVDALVDGFHNLQLAANGIVDNFLVTVVCGQCSREWIDGIRYQNVTAVRCPSCAVTNRIDSSGITVTQF